VRILSICCVLAMAASALVHGAEIRGTVRSAAGVALQQAVVAVSSRLGAPPFATAQVAGDGTFRLTTERLGGVMLTIAAPNHVSQTRDVFLSDATHVIDVAATLGTNRPKGELSEVKIVGDFNAWDWESAKPMERIADGTYRFTLPVKNGSAKYQLLLFDADAPEGTDLHTVNGTQYDELEYDGGGDFYSIVKSKASSVTIVFDPRKIPVENNKASFAFTAPAESDMQRLVQEVRSPMMAVRAEASKKAKTEQEFYNVIFEELAPLELTKVHEQLQGTLTPSQRQMLVAKALAFTTLSHRKTAIDTALVSNVMNEIPHNSKVWYLAVGHLVEAYAAVGRMGNVEADLRSITHEMGDDGADQLAWGLYSICRETEKSNPEIFAATYAELIREFPKHPATTNAKNTWDPNKKVAVGKPLPEFTYATLDNPSVVVSPASLKGKWVFIDLWATWCGPCVAEMPTIMKAYEEFKNDNVAFLSISLDQSVEKIAPFREKRFAMPWLHVFREGVFESDASKLFEVTGIPKPILVSPEGVITHITNGLRGPALLDTLRKVLRGG